VANTSTTLDSNQGEPVAFDDRTRRVMELRRLVRADAYHPSAEEVAQALLREWSALAIATREPAAPRIDANPDPRAFAARAIIRPQTPSAPEGTALTA